MNREYFGVNIITEIEQIHIYLNTDKYEDCELTFIIKDIDSDFLIWKSNSKILKGSFFWFKPNDFHSFNGFIIEIFESDIKIFENKTRLKNIHGNIKTEKQYLFIGNVGGMGDHFSVEPLIRKISESTEQKLIVFSYFPDVFINHPCIEKLIKIDIHDEDLSKNVPEEYSNEKIRYVLRCEQDKFGYLPYWNTLDLRQYAASQVGITLKKDELDYHFYPNDFKPIEELPEKYIVINPSITQSYRTWNLEKWQKLVDILNDNDINVVAIGKDIFNKSFYNLKIKKGINLCGDERQNDLSQVWHILNKSDMFITFDSGLFIFAGSTDTFILQIGSSLDPEYHAPYRNGIQTYNTIMWMVIVK